MSETYREQVLHSFGAKSSDVKELLAYNQNVFDFSNISQCLKMPLDDEKFVAHWFQYKAESEKIGLFNTLKQKLVQLQFPIQLGISQTEGYRVATRRGVCADGIAEATGLKLQSPHLLDLQLYQTQAGTIPIIISQCREDFIMLLQALIYKNEPVDIPVSMGACMIAGYNNWDRIWDFRKEWEKEQESIPTESAWKEKFSTLVQRKELYQDCFILLNDGPYSGVPAQRLGMSESEWRKKSLLIRREHECTHYITKRFFSSMQNNLLDEFIADYAGIVASNGCYRADWFLYFMGIERYPAYRKGARLENYCDRQSLSDSAISILQSLLVSAANNLQRALKTINRQVKPIEIIFALCSLTLEELASEQAVQRIGVAVYNFQNTAKYEKEL